MTILVTGGAGFIGSELTTQLVEAGHHVIVVDSLVAGRREHLAHLPAGRVRLVEADIRDRTRVRPLLQQVSVVYHLACINLRHALVAPREAHDVNATATLDVLQMAHDAGVPRFVHVSSSEVYGPALAPSIDETHPTLPTTVYGASKLAGEAYARAWHHTSGYPVAIVRPFNSYGRRSHAEGTSGEVIPRFLRRALAGRPLTVFGDGRQSRDFTHVTDTARGIRLAGSTDAASGRTINLGSGREVTMLELARLVGAVTGRSQLVVEHVDARPGDLARQRADSRLAQRLFGFEPWVTFEDGLDDLCDWYLEEAVATDGHGAKALQGLRHDRDEGAEARLEGAKAPSLQAPSWRHRGTKALKGGTKGLKPLRSI